MVKRKFKASVGTMFLRKGLKTKDGKKFTAVQVVLKADSLPDAASDGNIRLKGFVNKDNEDDNKFYSYLDEDDFVPKSKGKPKAAKKVEETEEEETTEETEEAEEDDDDESSPF